MKLMRVVLVFCVALMMTIGSLSAQSKVFGVTLTPAQEVQFKAFNDAAAPAKKAIRDNPALSDAEKHAQMKAVYDGIREKLKAILTPEQLKEMETAALTTSTGTSSKFAPSKVFGVTLTPVQQEQFKVINDAAAPAKKAIRDNAALSEDEKRAQMKVVYDGIREKLKAILTPEQLKDMETAQKK
jgi:Spy/CpxP family protein refolding chaperone